MPAFLASDTPPLILWIKTILEYCFAYLMQISMELSGEPSSTKMSS